MMSAVCEKTLLQYLYRLGIMDISMYTDPLLLPWLLWQLGQSVISSFPNQKLSRLPFRLSKVFSISILMLWVGVWVCHGG